MDSSTIFKLELMRADIGVPNTDVGTPKTGMFTVDGSGVAPNEVNVLAIVLAVLSVAFVVAMIIGAVTYIKRKRAGFSISGRATALFRTFMAFTILCSAGCAGGMAAMNNQSSHAATVASNTTSTTRQEVTAGGELTDEEIEFEAQDVIRVTNATPAGYKVYMKVDSTELKNAESEAKLSSIEEDETEVTTGTWGYKVGDGEEYAGFSTEYTEIASVAGATEADSEVKVSFKAKVAPEQEVGVYKADVSYAVVANETTYTLNYDANGGEMAEPSTQTSDPTIANSYDFTITDAVPTSAAAGLSFYGWSVTGDNMSDIYNAGETFTVTQANTTLKAVWGYGKYTINYYKNIDDAVTVNGFVPGQSCILMEASGGTCQAKITERVPNAEGYSFLGWSKVAYIAKEGDTIDMAREKVDYKPGDEISLTSDTELYAVWWAVSESDFQIELRWGEEPSDLDSHLSIINKLNRAEIGHIDFVGKQFQLEEGTIKFEAALDIDDTDQYGPETVTINMVPSSAYNDYDMYYYIENFSGENKKKLKESGAYIVIFRRGSSEEIRVDVKDAIGESARCWNVFAIRNGEIVMKNTLTSSPDTSY